MLHFRIVCAILMAWAANWAFGQPDAVPLLEEIPEMEYFGVGCAAWVGIFSLSRRQGWGMVVALANGVWAGFLSIVLAGFVYIFYMGMSTIGVAGSFERWLQVLQGDLEPLFEQMLNFPLMLKMIIASAVVGVVTEAIHWALIRLKKNRGEHFEQKDTVTQRGNPRDLW